ncbi:hypothetical protein [Clostridium vincentii]|uniref:Nudix hydrolase domain-containing protein n=1 Tax=Clostridium vincentii TaxID=52704 RepID=A0A2T0BF72_9CLOT|nr:hypothetical protein [Clostridium vincentii]PRR82556.1 hypothetical protein CLVI_16910 [Clostridium vincentii]
MAKIIACSLIIKDDFNNVLILNKRVKRGEIETWSILNQKIKGKEIHDKCITRCAKENLKALVFDVKEFKEYIFNKETDESIMVCTGEIRERFILDSKKYKDSKWVSIRNFQDYNFIECEKEMLKDFFAS